MRIGIAGPITLSMLKPLFSSGTDLPATYSFPLIASLAESLHRRGHEITIFALSPDVGRTQFFSGNRIQAFVCPRRRPRNQMLDFFRGERQALTDAMQQARCDVVHAHWTYEFGAAAVESGLPHVITAHDNPLAVLRFARHPYWLERPFLAWRVLSRAKCLTAVSPYIVTSLNRFLRPQKDITVVCNGVGPEIFALKERRSVGRQPDRIIFASVLNGWAGRKNGQQLVRAFALLRSRLGCDIELWMFGHEHQNEGPAEAWARQRSLDAGIRFLGPLPHAECLTKLAEQVDIFVHPSLEEAHSMAVTEAMAIGLPVIGGKYSGGISWTLADGKAGLLVDVTSPRSIADGMHAIAKQADLRRRLGLAGRELALSQYHIDTTVSSYETILDRASKEQIQ